MASKNSRKPALNHRIYEGLREEITAGKLKPGEALSRRQIASRYGTSYIPVIEALVRLEGSGLVEAESNQMARVRQISIETIRSDYVLREAYETQAIRLACESATEAELDELAILANLVDAQVPAEDPDAEAGPSEGLLLHWKFHKQIAELSRFPILVHKLERIETLARLQANWRFMPEMPDPPHWHLSLVEAIRARDPIRADQAMRDHVRRGLEKELFAYNSGKQQPAAMAEESAIAVETPQGPADAPSEPQAFTSSTEPEPPAVDATSGPVGG
ncbi:GntR family transcriptional regulator [Singulisphaera sp. PoT]|uniref:GntR family transcriptional regulator n=1 Tax=Singulisphaera sp. PoT TaxID=3411797 RepID=UPI003BF5611C